MRKLTYEVETYMSDSGGLGVEKEGAMWRIMLLRWTILIFPYG